VTCCVLRLLQAVGLIWELRADLPAKVRREGRLP
jgi:hypothetical protein